MYIRGRKAGISALTLRLLQGQTTQKPDLDVDIHSSLHKGNVRIPEPRMGGCGVGTQIRLSPNCPSVVTVP